MKLTDRERAMLDGRDGNARQKAMELLVRYAEVLGTEPDLLTPGTSPAFPLRPIRSCRTTPRPRRSARGSRCRRHSCTHATCKAASIPTRWETLGARPEVAKIHRKSPRSSSSIERDVVNSRRNRFFHSTFGRT
jgi:hypothetical protein